MKVVKPIDIYNTIEVDYTLTTSADEALFEWDPLKADYAYEDEVKVVADRKKYKLAAQTVLAGVVPKDNPTIWVESPLVEYAMFNYKNEYASEFMGNYVATLPNANKIDTLYLQDIDGDSTKITLYDVNNVELEVLEESIYEWDITSIGSYLFPDDPVLRNKIQFDFFHIDLYYIKIEILGTTTKARYGIVGYKDDVGITLRDGIGYSQNNFYTLERDSWGNLINSGQRLIEDASLPVLDYNTEVNKNANKVSRLFGSPNLWIADDRDRENVEFDFINMFAMLISNSITPGGTVSEKILKLEGV